MALRRQLYKLARSHLPHVRCQSTAPATIKQQQLQPETQRLLQQLLQGQRYALSRAITLVESTRSDHRQEAARLLSQLLQRSSSGDAARTFRIGLSGPPGVGKSTFIERFGKLLIQQGHRVAVLAVDPSSSRTGGSILGDKTRMPELSRDIHAYIRPSPNSGSLGGVARNTAEAIMLCEAAGHDICLVETVGVGQSETTVAEMVDMFCVFVPPAGGDELQGLKKGIIELADLVVVTKADGDLLPAARTAQHEYMSAMKFMQPQFPEWRPIVMRASSKSDQDIAKVWKKMNEYHEVIKDTGRLATVRAEQRTRWMWHQVSDSLLQLLREDERVQQHAAMLEPMVQQGQLAWSDAAHQLVQTFIPPAANASS